MRTTFLASSPTTREVKMSNTPENLDEFPETEAARHEAIINLARYWARKFPGLEVRTRVSLREVAPEPSEQDLRQTWLEETLDVAVIVQNQVAFFQVLREDREQTKKVLEAIARVIKPRDAVFS